MVQQSTEPWWKHGVVYQVYIRSFADSNGDGTGDINGLRSRLPYLKEIGVDAIWVNPWYKSPLADGGYDVADYRDIESVYGSLEQAEALIKEAHKLGLKLIPDLVPNHTSDQHKWFKEAVASPRDHPARDRYHIVDGRGSDGTEPPNDWTSVFGGPAWTRLPDGQWYLHLFAKEQPDLNWTNEDVIFDFKQVMRFWLDRGADGFRVDVAHGMCKDMTYPNLSSEKGTGALLEGAGDSSKVHPFWDRDEVQEIVREWRNILDSYHDRMMVAEAWVAPSRVPRYIHVGGYHQVFNFKLLETPWNATEYKRVITESVNAVTEVGATATWVLANHDVMRETTRLGLPPEINSRSWSITGPYDSLDAVGGARRARAAALIMLSLPGGAYLYQGQELGLPEVWDLPEHVLDDPVYLRSNKNIKGRDGCRVPIPWTTSGSSCGFGTGESWLPQPEGWNKLSVEEQSNDKTSSLALYKRALKLHRNWCRIDEKLEALDLGEHVVAYRRGSGITLVANMGNKAVDLPSHTEILLRSSDGPTNAVAIDEAVWLC